MPRESSIDDRIRQKLKGMPDVWAVKTHGSQFGRKGIPDWLVCYRGRMFAFETKRPGGKATELQKLEMSRLARAGATVGVVTSWEDVETALEGGRA